MNKYNCRIDIESSTEFEVEAENEEQAELKAREMFKLSFEDGYISYISVEEIEH